MKAVISKSRILPALLVALGFAATSCGSSAPKEKPEQQPPAQEEAAKAAGEQETTAAKDVTNGIVKLDPSLPLRGTINARWGLRVNTVEEERHPQ